MSQRELKLVWVNSSLMAEKRTTTDPKTLGEIKQPEDRGWKERWLKPEVIIPIVLSAISFAGMVFVFVTGLFVQVQENRIVEKLRNDEHIANAIVKKLTESSDLKGLADEMKKLRADSSAQYDKIQGEITKLNRDIGTIDGKLQGLERKVYEAKATALGVPDAEIVRTSLVPAGNNSFSKTVQLPDPQLKSLFVFTILGIKEGRLRIRVDGQVKRGAQTVYTLRDSYVTLPAVPGTTRPVPKLTPEQPTLFVTFLDRPTPESAVLALSEKGKTGS